jgi:hypothetical protein
MMDTIGVTAVVAVLAAAGLAVAAGAGVSGPGPGPAASAGAGTPRYYVQGLIGEAIQPPVVRATVTGAVTATIRCPWPGAQIAQQGIAATGNQTFFMICEKKAQRSKNSVITGSRIYRFQLTGSGRVSGYSLIPGGVSPCSLSSRGVWLVMAEAG